jgi:ZIP family zinc transporter
VETAVLEGALWGFIGASALIVAAEVAFRFTLRAMTVGLIMAFGVGTLISSIAFELVEPALDLADGPLVLVIGLLAGSIVFFLGDRAVTNMGGTRRRTRGSEEGGGTGLGIVLGTILDGIPESLVLGMSLVTLGGVSPALLMAIWVSNFPESLGATVDMRTAGRTTAWIRGAWWAIAAVSAAAAAIGQVMLTATDEATGAMVQAFAAGALLTMIADEMAPEAFGRSHLYTGLATTAGFVAAFLISTFE